MGIRAGASGFGAQEHIASRARGHESSQPLDPRSRGFLHSAAMPGADEAEVRRLVREAVERGGQRLVENDLLWFEEPISSDDVEGYSEIRRALKVRISGAEQLRGHRAFRRMVQERALDIIQPDVCICGGFTEYRKIAAMASANHVRVIPHMFGTAIRLNATLHMLAALPNWPRSHEPFPTLLEFDMSENALRTELAKSGASGPTSICSMTELRLAWMYSIGSSMVTTW